MRDNYMRSIRPVIVMASSAFLAVVAILFLYYFDNKYTAGGKQAENGILRLTEEEAENRPVRYLIEGWEYYPEVLLEPGSFQGMEEEGSRQIVKTGLLGRMNRDRAWTAGTYRMVLYLPDTGKPFALEIPAIQGASRVYVRGKLIGEWGSIEKRKTGMKSFLIPLVEGGRTELVIQAADIGGLHRCAFSPPLLGSYDTVMSVRDAGLLSKVMVLGLALAAAGLSLHLAVKIRWWRGFLFFLFCMCFIGNQLWPVVRAGVELGIQPWYGIQIFCFYSMLWLVIILENDLYRIKGGVVSAVMGAFCILALIYGCYAQYGTASASDWFGYITQWYKFAVACYLILVAYTALAEGMERSQTLLVIAVVFVSSLFMEQLLPLYEPVTGGSFLTVGCVVLMVGMLSILWQDMSDAFQSRAFFAAETERMNRQLVMQREHYRQLNARIEETRRIRHDMRHHVRLMQSYAAEGKLEEVRAYLGSSGLRWTLWSRLHLPAIMPWTLCCAIMFPLQ